MRVIHCVGDSHCSFFSGTDVICKLWPEKSPDALPYFQTHHLGGALAYNLIQEESRSGGGKKLREILGTDIPPGSRVMLCFGEIDCRAHLLRQSWKQQVPIEEIVRLCVNRYFEMVREVHRRGFEVMLYNAIPSRRKTDSKKKWEDPYAAVGSCRERNRITHIFNRLLREKCAEAGFPFLSNFDFFVKKSGLTEPWYFWDRIHLSQRAMPATLNALRILLPDLGIPPVKEFPKPGWPDRIRGWFAR